MSELEEWRATQTPEDRGCGCALLAVLGVVCLAFMLGALMGDYGGPPELAAENSRAQNVRVLLGFTGLGICTFAGAWLMSGRSEAAPTDQSEDQ
jgi:hypothetical protein